MSDVSASLDFPVTRRADATSTAAREATLANPGFGKKFTDHMAAAAWTPQAGWHDSRVVAYGPLQLDPAAAVLHYAQEIFEGLKAYRHPDGSVWTFRPQVNAARFAASAQRLALPELPEVAFLRSLEQLVATDVDWVPAFAEGAETSLYLRPFMFADEAFLGVRPADAVTYLVIASPSGPYFSGGIKPISLWLSTQYARSGPGGTGAAKCGGNYASSLAAQIDATEHGCDQVVYVDVVERKWIEESGSMNICFVTRDGELITPKLTGTILDGVTRRSVLELASDLGLRADEREISIDDWRDGARSGDIVESFACGTAAVITPIGSLKWEGGSIELATEPGPVAVQIRQALLDIQYGRAEDTHGWLYQLA